MRCRQVIPSISFLFYICIIFPVLLGEAETRENFSIASSGLSASSRLSVRLKIMRIRRKIVKQKQIYRFYRHRGRYTRAVRILYKIRQLRARKAILLQKLHCKNTDEIRALVTFENNSSYEVEVYLVDKNNQVQRFNVFVAPHSKETVSISLPWLYEYSGYESFGVAAVTYINENPAVGGTTFKYKDLPTIMPCTNRYRWEISNDSFTTLLQYYIFGVDAGPNLIITTESAIKTKKYNDFLNGGTSEELVKYWKLSESFSSREAAQTAFCQRVEQYVYWGLNAPCRKRYKYPDSTGNTDGWYWGCEGEIQNAITRNTACLNRSEIQ
jgi:hypothetical protein